MTGNQLKAAIQAVYTLQDAAKKLKVSRQTLYNQLNKAKVDSGFVTLVKANLDITITEDEIHFTGDLNQVLRDMYKKIIQLEANVRVLNTVITDVKHRVTGESITEISLDLEGTSKKVANKIFEEEKKKQ